MFFFLLPQIFSVVVELLRGFQLSCSLLYALIHCLLFTMYHNDFVIYYILAEKYLSKF